MTIRIPPLSAEARRSVWLGCVAITLATVAVSELATFLISLTFNLNAELPAYTVSAVVPLLLAGPMTYFQLKRLEQVRMAYRDLERAASTDWLTGCLNRGAFTALATAAAQDGAPGVLMIVDADDFKSINDTFGHEHGDQALRSIAGVIRANVRDTDLVGRLGGEEFGIYARDVSVRHGAVLAEAIREAVQDISFNPTDVHHALSVSIGVATAASSVTFARLFRIADQQLYAAKANGRNRVAITAAEAVAHGRAAA